MKKKISILGSTGSVGVSTLEVVDCARDQFEVVGLACGKNIERLKAQIQSFNPKIVSVSQKEDALKLQDCFPKLQVVCGEQGLIDVATHEQINLVVSALVGAIGLKPTWEAIQAKKDIALANKEVLVMAGALVKEHVKKMGVRLLPVDSEHSAIFQALAGADYHDIEKITLTASGGPFLNTPQKDFTHVTPAQALKHPSWKMGDRITIDSATMMNKGFEVIEAYWLFDLKPSQIEVLVHPQSIVHGSVSFCDGNVMSCLSVPDMKAPIAYALSYPNRVKTEVATLGLDKVGQLTFQKPDFEKFPLLKTAFDVIKAGGLRAAVLNAADEVAVRHFLDGKIRFDQIAWVIHQALGSYPDRFSHTLEAVFEADRWAREHAEHSINMLS